MSSSNSFADLSEKLLDLANNSMSILLSLNTALSSTDNQVQITTNNPDGTQTILSVPTLGALKNDIDRINAQILTLSSVDQRGAIIQPAKNLYSKIIKVDLNREPNKISGIDRITNFNVKKNSFFDNILNPLLKVSINLGDRIDTSVREVLSRRYIINFEIDSSGEFTTNGQNAIILFNNTFKNRTDISINEIETFLTNTRGITANKSGSKINYDEEIFSIDPNTLQYDGMFTILSTTNDTINKKMWFNIDTLDYYEISTGNKKTLAINDQLIINTNYATTRYSVVEISNSTSQLQVRLERIEGSEPIPVGIKSGMKFYSPIIVNKTVEVNIGFNEYCILFLKAINTDNYIVSRNWSEGVAFYTNDLTLSDNNNLGINGTPLNTFYVQSVYDYGEILKDLVAREIPRIYGIKPNSPSLLSQNFRVIQVNKHLTDTTDLENNKKQHQQATTLRSKLNELNNKIIEKRKELGTRIFKNSQDRDVVLTQITNLTTEANTTSQLLQSTTNEILANVNVISSTDPIYHIQGFWDIPTPVSDGKTRQQEVIGFKIEYKLSNLQGQESPNETFKVTNNGTITNASFSPWIPLDSDIRKRVYDPSTATWSWVTEDLSNIDKPNVNTLNIPLKPNEKISIRVKSISEVGYPNAILESDWSDILEYDFPTALLQGKNPTDFITKNAELENVRNVIIADLNSKGLDSHLADSVIVDSKFYAHLDDNIASKDNTNKVISLRDRLKQIELSETAETPKELVLNTPWVNFSNGYDTCKYYTFGGRVFLQGLIRVQEDKVNDRGVTTPTFNNFTIRKFKNVTRSDATLIGILPENYRPSSKVILSTVCASLDNEVTDGSTCRIDIFPDGQIILVNGNSGFVSLSGLSFRV